MSADRFIFTVTDLARFLGKSPVTLRGWERDGLISFPRDEAGNRKFTVDDVRNAAKIAYELKRIRQPRFDLVVSTLLMLAYVETHSDMEDG